MVRVHLVRHGRATGGWDADPDPGLDDVGRAQADRLVTRLAGLAPAPITCSPMRRCRETAAPLAAAWAIEPAIDPTLSEIPSPPDVPIGQRVPWLRAAMAGSWGDLDEPWTAYRDMVVAFVASRPVDSLIVSHFVAINAVIGASATTGSSSAAWTARR